MIRTADSTGGVFAFGLSGRRLLASQRSVIRLNTPLR